MATMRVGRVQLQILQILWREQQATARQITDALNAANRQAGSGGDKPVAHSTVQTLLRKLEAKGAITHDEDSGGGRGWVFRPVYQQADVSASAARDLLARVFDGSISGLVAHLLKHETIAPDELARLRRLVDEATTASAGVSDTSTEGRP